MSLVNQLVLSIEVSGAAIVLKHWMKLLVKITTTTITIILTAIITAITLILVNWLSSLSASTTNPDYTLLRLC